MFLVDRLYHLFIYNAVVFFFFKKMTAYEMLISDWSSDVCSSDLIVFAAIDGLVPCHLRLECVVRVAGLGQVGVAHPDRERDIAARHGGEGGAVGGEIARDQREQIR